MTEDFFDMQPLSRVNIHARPVWGTKETMAMRPKIAVKVADCIASWSEIETTLGLFLGILIDADPRAALAIYNSLENRAAQLRAIKAAAAVKLPADHLDVLTVLFTKSLTPAMKARDKFAHWCWGHAPELPDALLLTQPDEKLLNHFAAINKRRKGEERVQTAADLSKIFVVREPDAGRTLTAIHEARDWMQLMNGSVWTRNAPAGRAELLQRLSSEPRIQAGLARLNADRQKTLEAPESSPQPESSGAVK